MRTCATAAAEQRNRLRTFEQGGETVEVPIARQDARQGQRRPGAGRAHRRLGQRDVAWDHDHGDAALADGRAHRAVQDLWHLRGVRYQLNKMAAFPEQFLRMGLLEIAESDFGRGNLRRDGKHRRMAAMAVKESVDQVKIARAATSRAHRKISG
jgi:hypothetical protein